MAGPKDKFVHCVGNASFQPEEYITDAARQAQAVELLARNDNLYHATVLSFGLPEQDDYTYHAMTAVRLGQVQHIIGLGGANSLHAWYRGEDGSVVSFQSPYPRHPLTHQNSSTPRPAQTSTPTSTSSSPRP